MYYISEVRNDGQYGVTDTGDNSTEYYTAEGISELVNTYRANIKGYLDDNMIMPVQLNGKTVRYVGNRLSDFPYDYIFMITDFYFNDKVLVDYVTFAGGISTRTETTGFLIPKNYSRKDAAGFVPIVVSEFIDSHTISYYNVHSLRKNAGRKEGLEPKTARVVICSTPSARLRLYSEKYVKFFGLDALSLDVSNIPPKYKVVDRLSTEVSDGFISGALWDCVVHFTDIDMYFEVRAAGNNGGYIKLPSTLGVVERLGEYDWTFCFDRPMTDRMQRAIAMMKTCRGWSNFGDAFSNHTEELKKLYAVPVYEMKVEKQGIKLCGLCDLRCKAIPESGAIISIYRTKFFPLPTTNIDSALSKAFSLKDGKSEFINYNGSSIVVHTLDGIFDINIDHYSKFYGLDLSRNMQRAVALGKLNGFGVAVLANNAGTLIEANAIDGVIDLSKDVVKIPKATISNKDVKEIILGKDIKSISNDSFKLEVSSNYSDFVTLASQLSSPVLVLNMLKSIENRVLRKKNSVYRGVVLNTQSSDVLTAIRGAILFDEFLTVEKYTGFDYDMFLLGKPSDNNYEWCTIVPETIIIGLIEWIYEVKLKELYFIDSPVYFLRPSGLGYFYIYDIWRITTIVKKEENLLKSLTCYVDFIYKVVVSANSQLVLNAVTPILERVAKLEELTRKIAKAFPEDVFRDGISDSIIKRYLDKPRNRVYLNFKELRDAINFGEIDTDVPIY